MIPFTPAMPKALPNFIALITSKVVAEFKPAVACAAFPPLAAYADGLKFRYVDNVLHEATFMNLLIAPTGIGKGCVDEPVRQILSDVQRSDDENRERERQWKEECETMASTERHRDTAHLGRHHLCRLREANDGGPRKVPLHPRERD